MPGFFDAAEVEVNCPKCSSRIRIRLGDVRRRAKVRCPQGHSAQLEESGNGLAEADRALDQFRRRPIRLGRR